MSDNKSPKIPLPKSTRQIVWIVTIVFAIADLGFLAYRFCTGKMEVASSWILLGICIRELITIFIVYRFALLVARWRWLSK